MPKTPEIKKDKTPDPLPSTPDSWKAAWMKVNTSGVQDQNVSASKIGDKQFLKLRVLWDHAEDPDHRVVQFFNARNFMEECGFNLKGLIEARKLLHSAEPENPSDEPKIPTLFEKYLSHLESPGDLSTEQCAGLGAFALVDDHRREIQDLEINKINNDVEDPAEGTKIASHGMALRHRDPGLSYKPESFQGYSEPLPVTPKRPESPSEERLGRIMANLRIDSQATGSNPFGTPYVRDKTDSEGLSHVLVSRARDEQIVNAALIDLLKAITLCLPYYARWTLLRKAFYYDGMEARVDGCLESITGARDNPVQAIIEVKACTRKHSANKIRRQEAAQMVAWIATDDLEVGCKKLPNSQRRRILISQDREEIYVTFALYHTDYYHYLKGREAKNAQKRAARKRENEEAAAKQAKGKQAATQQAGASRGGSFLGIGRSKKKDNPPPGMPEREEEEEKLPIDGPFLKMLEFGPFRASNSKDIKYFGRLVAMIIDERCPAKQPGIAEQSGHSGSSTISLKQLGTATSSHGHTTRSQAAASKMSRPAEDPHPSSSSHQQIQSNQQYQTSTYGVHQQQGIYKQFHADQSFYRSQQSEKDSRYEQRPQPGQHLQPEQYLKSGQLSQPGQLSQSGQRSRSTERSKFRDVSHLEYHSQPDQYLYSNGTYFQAESPRPVRRNPVPPLPYQSTLRPAISTPYMRGSNQDMRYGLGAASIYQPELTYG